MKENELIALKQEIEEAKEQRSKLQGQVEALMGQLKDDYGCDTLKKAEKLLTDMEKELATLSNEIQVGLDELENEFAVS